MKQLFFLFFLSALFISCDNTKQEAKVDIIKPEMSKVSNHNYKIILDNFSLKKVENWNEYNELTNFLKRFKSTSPNEALSNAIELKNIIKKLKDSIRINDLKTASFKARVNVLENEALCLVDMTYISAITPKEVNTQIDKIFTIYSSVNAKINTVFTKKQFNEDINLDSFFKLDTTTNVKKKPTIKKEKKLEKKSSFFSKKSEQKESPTKLFKKQ